ncbi:FG-GAP-like repeat-containing protein [Streptomyces sp. NPDC087422]|uniref:FG-GAP-like repeat-containing protein n=1 Tax=Streptomyces sp. NPDC087422 TaxID=3365786 RepID=UPI00381E75E7
MAQRPRAHGALAALATFALAVSFGAGTGTVTTAAAADVPAGGAPTSFQAAVPWSPDARTVFAGASGVLRKSQDGEHEFWTRYADGSSTEVPPVANDWVTASRVSMGSDILTTLNTADGGKRLLLRDMADGGTSEIAIPAGQNFRAMAGSAALTDSGDRTAGTWRLHILRAGERAGDATTDTAVALPDDVNVFSVDGGDDRGAVLTYRMPSGALHIGYVDLAAAAFHALGDAQTGTAHPMLLLTPNRLAWYYGSTIRSVGRDDLGGPRTTATLPAQAQSTRRSVSLVGDSALVSDAPTATATPTDTLTPWGVPVVAVPLAGGAPVTVLPRSTGRLLATGDGRALVEGGADAADWAVRVLAADGGPIGTGVPVLPMSPAAVRVDGMTMDRGVVRYATAAARYDGSLGRNLYSQELGLADGLPTGPAVPKGAVAATAVPCEPGSSCVRLFGGSQQLSYLSTGPVTDGGYDTIGPRTTPGKGGRLVDAWGPYVAYASGTPARLYVFDNNSSNHTPVDQPLSAATVRGDILWRPTAAKGVLTADVIREFGHGPKRTVVTNAPCVPTELQSAGRWLYWSCGPTGPAGAYDLTANKNVALPSGTALLGDGYLVRHIGDHLVLNDFHGGTAAGPDRTIADLPAASLTDDRGWHWTVDRFGGGVAWADGAGTFHVLGTGVPGSPLENVGAGGAWYPSRPVGSWKVDYIRKVTGARVATRSFGAVREYYLAANWDERTDAGVPVPDGLYRSEVTARPADGQGPDLAFDGGTQFAQHGAPVAHDYTKDGFPDLFLTGVEADLDTVFRGTEKGDFTPYPLRIAGWGKGSLLVPTGDADGDGINDLLIRTTSGELRRLPGRSDGTLPDISGPSVLIGPGWNIYNAIVSPGDLNRDGFPDAVARDAAGVLWRYDGTSRGTFAPRVRIGPGWNIFNKIVGANDLNGDGAADLLARDTAGVLWRYDGSGRGTFAPRVRIGAGWQIYKDIVGIGDLSQDGRNDVLAADASGVLYRYDGSGKGTFAPRKSLGGSWSMVKALY